MKKIIVIGIGNTLRSDDGLGAQAAARLSEMLEVEGVDIMEVQQLTPEEADLLQQYDVAIFIDASYKEEAGTIKYTQLVSDETIGSGFTHHFSPERILLLVKEIYKKEPKAYLFTVGAQTFELGEELSPPVQKALPELLNKVMELIKQEKGEI